MRTVLVRIDAATGERTTIVDDDGADLSRPVISPDASSVVYLRESYGDAEQAPRITLHRFDFEDARVVDLASGWDRWPTSAVWLRTPPVCCSPPTSEAAAPSSCCAATAARRR